MPASKTQQALALIDSGAMNAHAAAKAIGIKPNTVYVALAARRRRAAHCCTTCGQPLPNNTGASLRIPPGTSYVTT